MRFFYPRIVNPHLMKNTSFAENPYDHACGEWGQGFNRFFDNTITANAEREMTLDK